MSINQESELPTPIPVHVFLSYASEDRERAAWLHDKLMEANLASVWFDDKDIEGGDYWENEIDDGLRKTTVLVALLTKNSTDRSREWIEYERSEAVRLHKPIIPLRYEDELPEHMSHLQCIDFTRNEDAGLAALLKAIDKHTLRYTSRPRLPGKPPPIGDAFVGRELELQKLVKLIDGPSARVETGRKTIAIQGMGGEGKTMLVKELVRRIALRYPGGVIFEERGESRTPAREVFESWARRALGRELDREYKSADVQSLLAGYGELLVVIDDVSELDFGDTNQLLESLPPDATRIVTTRSVDAKSELGCLMYPLARLSDTDAHQMVRERLLAMDMTATPYNSPKQDIAISRLVDLVQGNALALEVTSARCNLPQDLTREVDDLAKCLAEGVEGVSVASGDNKGNSLEVSLTISLKLLRKHDEDNHTNWAERFAALGIFPDSGRISRELIAAVWGDDEDDARTFPALNGLFRRAMLKLEPDDIYRSHPLLSAFARSLLRKEPDRLAETERRYRDFLTRTAEQGFSKPEEQWSDMELYTPHLLHTAAKLWNECTSLLGDLNALALPEAPVAGIALATPGVLESAAQAAAFAHALMPYVLRRPALGEDGRRVLTLGLACVRATGNEQLMDTFVRALGVWYARGKTAVAEDYFEQALRWAEDTDDPAEKGKVLSDYGELQRNRTKFDHAIELLERALVIHEELDAERMQAVTLKSLGEAYARRCDFEIGMSHYNRAIELYKSLEDLSGEADLLNKVGSVEFNRGNYQAAIDKFNEALPIHEKLRNRSMEGEDRNDMGISYTYLKKPELALPYLKEAIEIHGQLGNRRLEAIAISNRAATHYMLGPQQADAYETAVLDARRSAAIAGEIEDKLTEVWALNWEALAQQELHRPELALLLLERAVAMLDEAGPRERVSTWGNLGYLLGKHLDQREWGAVWLRRAITLMSQLMSEQKITRAFGGRTRPELEAMLQEIST